MICSVAPGMIVSFSYPRGQKEAQRIRVSRVSDVRQAGPDIAVALDPLLALDRWMIRGRDLEGGGELAFFLSKPRPDGSPALLGPWRVYLVDNDGSSPELVYEAQDVAEAAGWAEEWNADPRNRDLMAVLCPPTRQPVAT